MRSGTTREAGLWDRLVNAKAGGEQVILDPDLSVKVAKRLYRRAMGHAFPGKVVLVSGNRYTWVRGGVLSVNPDKREPHCRGVRAMVHDISHYCHARLHPRDAPHSARQAYLERDLLDFAIKQGWLPAGGEA